MLHTPGDTTSVIVVRGANERGTSAPATVIDAGKQSPKKRSRLGKPKVRTGCVTCKIRRVKCDEGKPNCIRCLSTGRTCDGYNTPNTSLINITTTTALPNNNADNISPTDGGSAPPSVKINSNIKTTTTLWNPLLNHSGTRLEHRYLAFFQRRTAPILSGYFDAYFWNGLLLQVGHSEPTIQHAMMAVASIHEQVEVEGRQLLSRSNQPRHYDSDDGDGLDHSRYFALQQYNKAIACLNRRLSSGPQSEQITLLCCVLFICLEFLRGNIETAIAHLHSGLHIMTAWRAQNSAFDLQDNEATMQAVKAPEPHSIPDNLVQMFSRLTIQSMLCGRDPRAVLGLRLTDLSKRDLAALTPDVFPTLQAARTALDYLMKISLQLIRDSHTESLQFKPEFTGRIDEMTSALDRWSRAFDLFLVGSLATRTTQEVQAAVVLRILNTVAKIWLASSTSMDESIFDGEMEAFSSIINLAASIIPSYITQDDDTPLNIDVTKNPPLSRHHHHPLVNSFTFEMGVIPPLYFVALKCRNPSLRRRAMSLLEHTQPRREGFWIADLQVAIVRRVIEIEEVNLEAEGAWCRTSVGELVLLPPEWRRVADVRLRGRGEGELERRVQRVGIVTKSQDMEGGWDEAEEDIFW